MKLVIATGNNHKLEEMKKIFSPYGYEIIGQKEIVEKVEIIENGTTFLENSKIKACTISNLCDELVLADDSGLEIDALNKEPGIYSARYLGEDTSYDIKNNTILKRMEGVENRSARFVCAMSLCKKGKEIFHVEETIEGIIGDKPMGENGFGYDPIFFYPPMNKSTSEMTMEEKNEVSHRGKATKKMIEFLKNYGNKN